MKNKKIIIYTDGGARGNPGPAGIGAVLYNEDQEVLAKISQYLGVATNNQSRVSGFNFGSKAIEIGAEEVNCYLDSELVVCQLNREYKVKNKDLAPLFLSIYNLSLSFKKITFTHIPRERNKLADQLANEAMDRGA